ncbi:MAG TPA: CoA ester lyase [Gaiellaceae bacterium]|nr:CoA ester lyase [Gaiellaceae bacterium]
MSPVSSIRSLLFAPGNDARKLEKALEAGADAVVADLEDAVPAPEKGRARDLVRDLVAGAGAETFLAVRVNGVGTAFWEDDLRLLSELPPDALVLPKATPEGVAALGPDGPPVIGIAETAQGLRLAYETASSPRTVALLLGAVDLGLELGLEPRADGQEVLFARSKLVVDSIAAGIRSPFDLVHVDVRDDEGLEAECRLARSLGLRGKACIHPAQVAIVNRVFSPSEEEADRARRIVRAYEEGRAEGRGVVALDGEMIDLPVVERARQVLAARERSPSDDH